jgi:hypothetical protein
MDGRSAGEHQEGLRDNAGLHVTQQLQADGAAALGGMGCEEAQVAAPPVPICARVGSWRETHSSRRQRQREGWPLGSRAWLYPTAGHMGMGRSQPRTMATEALPSTVQYSNNDSVTIGACRVPGTGPEMSPVLPLSTAQGHRS